LSRQEKSTSKKSNLTKNPSNQSMKRLNNLSSSS